MILKTSVWGGLAALTLFAGFAFGDDTPERVESAVLRQELVAFVFDAMKAQDPDSDVKELEERARGEIAVQVVNIRRHYADFLMVSPEDEKTLLDGKPIAGVAKRIEEAEKFLKEFEIPLSGAIKLMLPLYKEGKLPPVRVELLAQLLRAEMKKVEDALTG